MAESASDYYRYCPGEEHLKLSNAICLGRRRKNFPKCPGCQFNDDERGKRSPSVPMMQSDNRIQAEERAKVIEKLFKAYDVRGVYPEPLNEDAAWRIGHATGAFLRSSLTGVDRGDPNACTVVVGRDMRKSSPSLSQNLVEGILSSGAGVIDIGMVDTPQVYFAINHLNASGGVMTTASHNPSQYNGFKISGRKAAPIGSDTGLKEIAIIAQNMIRHDTRMRGNFREHDLTDDYRAFVRSFLYPPRPMRVVIDASNGMAGKWLPLIFDGVPGLEMIYLNMEHKGDFAHDPNPLVDENLHQLQEAVRSHGADLGACFDPDADRCIFVDEKADIVRCDMLTSLLARIMLRRNPGATVVYDLRSSRVVAEEIKAAGGVPRRERVGHAFMKKALGESKGIMGGELSGHFYFRDNFYCDSGLLTLVHTLNLLTTERAPLSVLVQPLQRYSASGERNFENPNADLTIKQLAERYRQGRIDYLDGITVQFDDWWFNVRKSNTEPLLRLNLEAASPQLLQKRLAELAPQLGTPKNH